MYGYIIVQIIYTVKNYLRLCIIIVYPGFLAGSIFCTEKGRNDRSDTVGEAARCIQKLRKSTLRLKGKLNHCRASIFAYLAKKGEKRKDKSALVPVTYFSVDA